MTGCEDLIRPALQEALSTTVKITSDNGDCEIRFPFVRPDGDEIHIWVIDQGDYYTVTDEGDTHGMLQLSGISIETKSRKRRIEAIRERFDLDRADYEIMKKTPEESLGQAILQVYEAIQHIASLEHTRHPYPQDDFRSEVAGYLNSKEIPFISNDLVEAYAEPVTIDFTFPRQEQPTFMQAIRANEKTELHTKCRDASYRYIQIRRVRESSQFISLVDDDRGRFDEDQMKPILAESDKVFRWTNRAQLAQTLSA